MSGVLHPVGPEPARTYWVRRGVLLAVVLVVALGIVLAVASLTKAAVATAPPPVIAPASTPSASGTSGISESPQPSPTPTAELSGTPSPSTSTSVSESPSTSSTPSTSASTKPSTTPSTKATPVATPDCRPTDLTVTLKGERSLSPGEHNTFDLTLINGGSATCLASVTDGNFEHKIYSGTDRIWSSRDCSKPLKPFDKKLASQADVAWTMTWNGERSVPGKDCKTGDDTPRPGTYWATAQLKGAEPVQLRMIIS